MSQSLTIKISANASNFSTVMKSAAKTVEDFASKNKATFDSVAKTADSMANKIAGGIKALGAVAIGGSFGLNAFMKSASELQSLKASFTSLTGSIEQSNKVMQILYDFAKKTSFTNEQIQNTAKSFLSMGVSVEALPSLMQDLGDIAGATGADLGMMSLQISQAFGKGKLEYSDWKILSTYIGALRPILEDVVKKRTGLEDLNKAFSKGAVSADILREALALANDEGNFAFQGAIKQSETYAGRMGNLEEAVTNVGLSIIGVDAATGEIKAGGVFDNMSKKVERTTEWLEENKETITKVANAIIDNLIPASITLGSIWLTLKTIAFAEKAIDSFNKLSKAIKAVNGALKITQGLKLLGGGAWNALVAGLGLAKAGFMTAASAAWGFAAALLANPITWIVIAIVAVVGALTWFFTQTEIGKQIWQGFMEFLGGLWNGLVEVVGEVVKVIVDVWNGIVGAVVAVVDAVVGVWNGVMSFLAPVFDVIWRVVSGLFIFVVAVLATIAEGIFNLIAGAIMLIAGFVGWIWDNVIVPVGQFFVDLWNGVVEGIGAFVSTAGEIIGGIIGFFVDLWNGVVTGVTEFIDGVVAAITPIVEWINANIIAPIAGFFSGLWNGVVNSVTGFIQGFMGVIKPITDWINNNVVQPISRFFAGLWNGITQGLRGLADGVRNIFGTIVGLIKLPINGVIKLINGVIGGINSVKVPDWVPGLGGMKPNIPKIPLLAKGGVVDNATLAVIGEAGKEAVMPLENNTGWISNLASQIAERGGSGGVQNVTLNISVNVDNSGREFSDEDGVRIAKIIDRNLRAQGLTIGQIGAMR